jgi:hypothetical protein
MMCAAVANEAYICYDEIQQNMYRLLRCLFPDDQDTLCKGHGLPCKPQP